MKTSLIIMAAGIGSRFGTGIKQLAAVDDGGHIIIDYSIHDAIKAGFDKIVFVIRHDIEAEFREVIGDRIEEICKGCGVEVHYAFQALDDIPGQLPEGRSKPWGTGQAVLAAKDVIDEPFAVINADDFYGRAPYELLHSFLTEEADEACLAGYLLRNTLSDNGTVTRGVCRAEGGYLTSREETKGIAKTQEGARSGDREIDIDSVVSMNMWGFKESFIGKLDEGFRTFFEKEVPENPQKAEYLIPIFVGELLSQGKINVRVIETDAVWCGMTYKEDIPVVRAAFREMIERGDYSADLFSDL